MFLFSAQVLGCLSAQLVEERKSAGVGQTRLNSIGLTQKAVRVSLYLQNIETLVELQFIRPASLAFLIPSVFVHCLFCYLLSLFNRVLTDLAYIFNQREGPGAVIFSAPPYFS